MEEEEGKSADGKEEWKCEKEEEEEQQGGEG